METFLYQYHTTQFQLSDRIAPKRYGNNAETFAMISENLLVLNLFPLTGMENLIGQYLLK